MPVKLPIAIQPLGEAVKKISARTPIGSKLRTEEWSHVPLALRERAMFSAGVESARFLADAQRGVEEILSFAVEQTKNGAALIDRSSLIARLREVALREGIPVDPAKRGGLQDITSRARLGLIIDINTQQAQEYARWKAEQDPDVLDAFPAQELIRLEDRVTHRRWATRWLQAGGTLVQGRMVALKSSPIWTAISRFGTPWPPFDFNSGMGLEDIFREDAEALGLLTPADMPQPQEESFNKNLRASTRGLGDGMLGFLSKLFGDKARIEGDEIIWDEREAA